MHGYGYGIACCAGCRCSCILEESTAGKQGVEAGGKCLGSSGGEAGFVGSTYGEEGASAGGIADGCGWAALDGGAVPGIGADPSTEHAGPAA